MKNYFISCNGIEDITAFERNVEHVTKSKISDGKYVIQANKNFASTVAVIWQQMGEKGMLFIVDLDNPVDEAILANPTSLKSQFVSSRHARQADYQVLFGRFF